MRHITAAALFAVTLLSTFAVAGCGGGGGNSSSNSSPATQNTANDVPFIAKNDLQFIDALAPHHVIAIQEAKLELQKGTRPEVKAIAQGILDAQTQELASMMAARKELTGAADVPPPTADPVTQADLVSVQQATSAQTDAAYLAAMIPHHAGGITIDSRALPNLKRPDMIQLATKSQADQAREIGEMQALRQ